LKLICKDWDIVGKNDYIGSYYFPMEDIEKNVFSNPQWIYIYGTYTESPFDNEIFDYMNLYPDMASWFKG